MAKVFVFGRIFGEKDEKDDGCSELVENEKRREIFLFKPRVFLYKT